MKVKFLGHACFLITSNSGVKIITDPYKPGGELKYGEITESADIVTVSHDHFDHNNVDAIKENPKVIKEPAPVVIKGIPVQGIPVYHDEQKGKLRGRNIIFSLEVDGMRVCHMGDLGHALDDKQITSLGRVDILLIPVGGYYTITARVATEIADAVHSRVIIPMHYKNEKCALPITPVDDFLAGKKDVIRLNASETEFKAEGLPKTTQIIVLKPAM